MKLEGGRTLLSHNTCGDRALLVNSRRFFGARAYEEVFQDNPPVNEEMLRTMMMQMG